MTTGQGGGDALARGVADATIVLGHLDAIDPELRQFVSLPLGHSEDLVDQERALALVRPLGEEMLKRAMHHHDIVARFGRFLAVARASGAGCARRSGGIWMRK